MPAIVLHLTDLHLTRTPGLLDGIDPDARLAAVLAAWEARRERPDLVVVTGDDAEDGSPEAYERLAAALGRIDAPWLCLPGNHDTAAGVAEGLPGPDTAEVGAWRVVGFDTAVPGEVAGALDVPAALGRLDSLDDRPTVVALHHPPRSPSTHPWFALEGADDLLAGLAGRPHVKAVLSGHLHQTFEYEGPGGVALLGGPSTYKPIRHDGDTWESRVGETGARILRLADDGTFTWELLVA